MLDIITVESMEELSDINDKRILDLRCTREIEDTFKRIVEWEEKAFRDKESLEFMKKIDGAVRQGDYGVVTRFGKSCITCLSTGCKLGLLLLYYRNEKRPHIITQFEAAGDNVWNCLRKDYGVELYMLRLDAYRGLSENYCSDMEDARIIIDGILFSEKKKDIREKYDRYIEEQFIVTKEKEEQAYSKYADSKERVLRRYLQEEMTLEALYDAIAKKGEVPANDCPKGYRVINYCTEIPAHYIFRRLPLWIMGRKGLEYEFRKTISVKYPTLLELLADDIINKYEYEHDYNFYRLMYDEYFVLVLNDEERCKVSEYPEKTLYGVLCNSEEKLVTIYSKRQAVEKFHEMMAAVKEMKFIE